MNSNKKHKVIIIGSGLGGLSCGYILQRKGFNVTILEQGRQIGGCLQCFRRAGAVFETGMHFIGSASPGQQMHGVMDYLGLNDDVHLQQLDPQGFQTISLGGQQFTIPNGREAFLERMGEYFPKEKDGLRRYIDIIDQITSASTLNSLIQSGVTNPERDLSALTLYQTLSINSVLDELFHDEMLKSVLVGDLPLYSAEKEKTPFSHHAFIMDFYNQSAYRVVGGSDAIARSLQSSIERLGGRVETQKKVIRIVCDDTHATSVECDDETFYSADYVISTIHPARLMDMLDTHLIRPAYKSRIRNLPNTAASFALYVRFKDGMMPYMNSNFYGYDGLSPWGCEKYTTSDWPKGFLYMHMCHEANPQYAKAATVLSYMNIDDVIRWQGTKSGRRGEDYDAFKREHALRLIERIDAMNPGFSDAIESFYTSTPLTYLDHTGTEGGSMYGIAKDINSGATGRVSCRTKIPNLFLAGQNINSHGMMGVIVGTLLACEELSKSVTT